MLKKTRTKSHFKETKLQMAISKYIKLQYTDVIFTAEASGIFKSRAQAGISAMQRSGSKLPDMMIDEARGGYFGLRLEIKTLDKSPYLKDGRTIRNDKHVQGQYKTLLRLRKKGYCAVFTIGFDDAKKTIDHYMTLPTTKPI